MSSEKLKRITDKKSKDLIINQMVRQLTIDVKRGLLPYTILFLIELRPHYALEVYKKILKTLWEGSELDKNIIYDNLKRLEKRGIAESYMEKSSIGAKRKYYKITDFGRRVFKEILINRLWPLTFMSSTIIEDMVGRRNLPKKVINKKIDEFKKIVREALEK